MDKCVDELVEIIIQTDILVVSPALIYCVKEFLERREYHSKVIKMMRRDGGRI